MQDNNSLQDESMQENNLQKVCYPSRYHSNRSYSWCTSAPNKSMPSCIPDSSSKLMIDPSHHIKGRSSGANHEESPSSPYQQCGRWWVVSHHLSAKDYTKMVLVWLSSQRRRMGSKPTASTKALMSLVRKPYG